MKLRPSTSSSEKKWACSAMKRTDASVPRRRCTSGAAAGSSTAPLLAAQAEADDLGQLLEQRFLVVEVPVEEALGHAGLAHDVDDAGLRVAPLGEQPRCAVEQLLLALEPLRGEAAVGVHGDESAPP